MNKYYGNAFDLLKIVLSFFVVAIHVNPFGTQYWYIRYPICRIAVPLFFMMSSYFFFKKINKQELKGQLKTLVQFIKRNFILYISWFIVLWPITYEIWGKKYTLQELFFEIPSRMFFSSTFKSSWYLMALVICVVIVFFLTRKTNNTLALILGLACYIVAAMLSNYKILFQDVEWLQIIQQSYPYTICYSFPVGILFVVMGKMMAEKDIKVTRNTYIKLLISTLLLFIETYLVISNEWYGETPCYMMLIPFCYYFFMVVSKMNIKIPYGKEIRVISTIIYCFHFSFKYAINDYLVDIGWNMSILPYSLYLYLIVIFVSICVALLIYKLSQRKYFRILKNFY